MFDRLKRIFSKPKQEEKPPQEPPPQQVQEEEVKEKEEKTVRPLTEQELEIFKKGMGITPHNYWQWASRTKNFKLLTDGEYVWVEGFEDHKGKQLPLTQQRAWSWEFIKQRLKDFG